MGRYDGLVCMFTGMMVGGAWVNMIAWHACSLRVRKRVSRHDGLVDMLTGEDVNWKGHG